MIILSESITVRIQRRQFEIYCYTIDYVVRFMLNKSLNLIYKRN